MVTTDAAATNNNRININQAKINAIDEQVNEYMGDPKIGASIMIPDSLLSDEDVQNNMELFKDSCEDACRKFNCNKSELDEQKSGGNTMLTCLIKSCKDGFILSDNKLECIAMSAEEMENQKKQIIKALQESTKNMHVGSKVAVSIPRDMEQDDDIAPEIDNWLDACYAAVLKKDDKHPDGIKYANTAGFVCTIGTCDEPDYVPSADKLSCVENRNKKDNPYFQLEQEMKKDIEQLTSAYDAKIKSFVDDCVKNDKTIDTTTRECK